MERVGVSVGVAEGRRKHLTAHASVVFPHLRTEHVLLFVELGMNAGLEIGKAIFTYSYSIVFAFFILQISLLFKASTYISPK